MTKRPNLNRPVFAQTLLPHQACKRDLGPLWCQSSAISRSHKETSKLHKCTLVFSMIYTQPLVLYMRPLVLFGTKLLIQALQYLCQCTFQYFCQCSYQYSCQSSCQCSCQQCFFQAERLFPHRGELCCFSFSCQINSLQFEGPGFEFQWAS